MSFDVGITAESFEIELNFPIYFNNSGIDVCSFSLTNRGEISVCLGISSGLNNVWYLSTLKDFEELAKSNNDHQILSA